MAERYTRFHINVMTTGKKPPRRTTISVETLVAELFALRLGFELESPEGHRAIREWLQEKQDEQKMDYADSGLLKRAMLLEVVDQKLLNKYYRHG